MPTLTVAGCGATRGHGGFAAFAHPTNFFFVGAAAMAENDGHKVPLRDYRGGNNTYTHVGNDGGACPVGRSDLMTGYPWKTGFRYAISRLDLAILKDVGLPVA